MRRILRIKFPVLGLGAYRYQLISDLGGLSQFGAFIEELPPGAFSGHRHWHEAEDEMVYMLSGEVVLIEDSETSLRAGDTACWPAGVAIGHRLANRVPSPARYFVIGTRAAARYRSLYRPRSYHTQRRQRPALSTPRRHRIS